MSSFAFAYHNIFKSWADIDEDKLEQDLIKKFKLSGLVNADQAVIDAELKLFN
jgi:ATP-dependent helicase/DNAse subunit B